MFSSSQVPQPSHTAYILPILHNLSNCKHEEQADGGLLIRVSLDVISLCDFVSPETCLCDYLCAVQFLYDLTTHLQSMKNKPTGAG
jgi:hypothetical protein